MVERKPALYVSSDVAGLWQDLRKVDEVYAPIRKDIEISGMELLAFGTIERLFEKIAKARELGFEEVSLHGRTGGEGSSFLDGIKVWAIDNLQLLRTDKALKNYAQEYEILLHAPEAKKKKNLGLAQGLAREGRVLYIWIENNSSGLDGVREAIDAVGILRSLGVPSGMMLDICHALGKKNLSGNGLLRSWSALVTYLVDNLPLREQTPEARIWEGLHLPIGSSKGDSLRIPKREIPQSFLEELGLCISAFGIRRIVLENLHGAQVIPIPVRKLQAWTQDSVDELVKAGIISAK